MWKVEYTKRFLKDLADLPTEIQARIEPIVFQELESDNPFDLGYLEKMKGYLDKYKIRVGDYRIGISIEKETQTLIGGSASFKTRQQPIDLRSQPEARNEREY